MHTRRHGIRLLRWLAMGALILLWARAGVALAHAVIRVAEPSPNAILETAPTQVRLFLTEPVAPAFSRIAVYGASGRRMDNGDLKAEDADNTILVVTLPPLPNGTYLVSWEVLSSVDGHSSTGSYPFGVGVSRLAAVSSERPTPWQFTPLSAGARWLNLAGLALLLGLFVFRLFVWNPALAARQLDGAEERLDLDFGRTSLKIGSTGLVLVGLTLVIILLALSSTVNLLTAGVFQAWLDTRYGTMWLIRFLFVVLLGFGVADLYAGLSEGRGSLRGWEWWAWPLSLIGLTLATSLTSHSAALATDTALAISVDVVHVLAAGIWVGGLLQLAVALWQTRRLAAVSRTWLTLSLLINFSALAAGAVGALLVSGGYLALKHIGSWAALFDTVYGWALIAKIALAAPAFGIAAINLLIVKPRLNAISGQPDSDAALRFQRRFTRLVRAEALFAVLVLTAAAVLTDLQRGQDAPRLADQGGRIRLTQTADDLRVTLTLEPALVGQNTFDVFVTTANGQAVTDAREVSLRFTPLSQSVGTSKATAEVRGDGHYRLEGGYVSLAGPWQIEVVVRRADAFDAFADFQMEADGAGLIRPADAPPDLLLRLAKLLTQSGGAITGALLAAFAVGWVFLARRAARNTWQFVPLLVPGLIALAMGGAQLITFIREATPAKFASNPIQAEAASIAQGQALYTAYCEACHGPAGRGDGPEAARGNPPPSEFTASRIESQTDGDLHYRIKAEVSHLAVSGQWRGDDVWHLVNYLRALVTQRSQTPGSSP